MNFKKNPTKLNYIFWGAHIFREITEKVIIVKVRAMVTSSRRVKERDLDETVEEVSERSMLHVSFYELCFQLSFAHFSVCM